MEGDPPDKFKTKEELLKHVEEMFKKDDDPDNMEKLLFMPTSDGHGFVGTTFVNCQYYSDGFMYILKKRQDLPYKREYYKFNETQAASALAYGTLYEEISELPEAELKKIVEVSIGMTLYKVIDDFDLVNKEPSETERNSVFYDDDKKKWNSEAFVILGNLLAASGYSIKLAEYFKKIYGAKNLWEAARKKECMKQGAEPIEKMILAIHTELFEENASKIASKVKERVGVLTETIDKEALFWDQKNKEHLEFIKDPNKKAESKSKEEKKEKERKAQEKAEKLKALFEKESAERLANAEKKRLAQEADIRAKEAAIAQKTKKAKERARVKNKNRETSGESGGAGSSGGAFPSEKHKDRDKDFDDFDASRWAPAITRYKDAVSKYQGKRDDNKPDMPEKKSKDG